MPGLGVMNCKLEENGVGDNNERCEQRFTTARILSVNKPLHSRRFPISHHFDSIDEFLSLFGRLYACRQ